ncbi:NAD(P)-dependent oxidoreductase [Pseudomonas sp. L1(2025)]|uniref:NAD(P)-dependent oxidoreductase n=1 Tax=Pseudomonas sp. L1(2025) TaxID=3449429 RepID=UPI003F6905D1
MKPSCVPPVAASLIATTGNVLHIAPVSRGWKADAPANVVFFPPTLTKQALLMQIGLLRPSTLIIGDQIIDADVIDQWRISHPFGTLHLVRRGTSLDKVALELCALNDIRVVNTPGVNAPHVAAYIAYWLTLADGSIPRDVCVMGYGNVGKELVRLLLDRDPDVRIKVINRQGRAPDNSGNTLCNSRVSFVADWRGALHDAYAVAICLSLNDESAHRIDRSLIQGLHKNARLVCVAKPDVFSDDALQSLATAEDMQLVLDYGPKTLDAFRMRTQALGCSVGTWRKPATLTTQAATTEACKCDLDYAVSVQLSLMALRGLVSRKLAHSLRIPAEKLEGGAPRVSIIGRGINGLFQAVMFRLANYQVTVYGGNQQRDGASNTLIPANQYLTVECNRAGVELFEKFLADNSSLAQLARSGIDEAYRADASDVEVAIGALLQRSGVRFVPRHLSPAEIAELSREHLVVTNLDPDGLSIVHWSAYNQIVAGATYAGGTTQGLLWASLVEEIIQAKAPDN